MGKQICMSREKTNALFPRTVATVVLSLFLSLISLVGGESRKQCTTIFQIKRMKSLKREINRRWRMVTVLCFKARNVMCTEQNESALNQTTHSRKKLQNYEMGIFDWLQCTGVAIEQDIILWPGTKTSGPRVVMKMILLINFIFSCVIQCYSHSCELMTSIFGEYWKVILTLIR